jgi:hypothetical protein
MPSPLSNEIAGRSSPAYTVHPRFQPEDYIENHDLSYVRDGNIREIFGLIQAFLVATEGGLSDIGGSF